MAEKARRIIKFPREHPILTGLAVTLIAGGTVVYVAGGVGGGFLRRGVLRGSVDDWFNKFEEMGYEPAWIIPHVNFRVVIVKAYRTPLSLAPIVGTYDFYGIWELPLTRFIESRAPE